MPKSLHQVQMDYQGQAFPINEREFVTFRIQHPVKGTVTLTVSGGGQVHYEDATGRKHIAVEELQVEKLPGRTY
jgi:hypothetical protein